MSPVRKEKPVNGSVYHVYNRSIAKFVIFNSAKEFERMVSLLNLLRFDDFTYSYSKYQELTSNSKSKIIRELNEKDNKLVNIISYCIMPTHLHLVLQQNKDKGVEKFVGKVLNAYTKYFNIKHQRSGPLWQSRFKSVAVEDDEQLLHLTRYTHLNPTSANLVDNPEDWEYSSYREYVNFEEYICDYKDLLTILPKQYKKFVEHRKDYQKNLATIKNIIIDEYSG